MVISITFAAAPNPVEANSTTYLSGNMSQDGVPLIDQAIEVYLVEGPQKILNLITDADGNFGAEVTPDETWIGSHDLQVWAPAQERLSNIVTLVVTAPGEKPPINPVAVAVFLLLARYVLDNL